MAGLIKSFVMSPKFKLMEIYFQVNVERRVFVLTKTTRTLLQLFNAPVAALWNDMMYLSVTEMLGRFLKLQSPLLERSCPVRASERSAMPLCAFSNIIVSLKTKTVPSSDQRQQRNRVQIRSATSSFLFFFKDFSRPKMILYRFQEANNLKPVYPAASVGLQLLKQESTESC